MKYMNVIPTFFFAALLVSPVSSASEEFYGSIESRPEGGFGTWVVSGRNVEVTDKTQLVEEYGRLDVGACVEVEHILFEDIE